MDPDTNTNNSGRFSTQISKALVKLSAINMPEVEMRRVAAK